jgi:hypothetical protein
MSTADLDEAKAILAALVAEMNAKWNGRVGPPMAYFSIKGGGYASYVVYTANGIKEPGPEGYGGPLAPTAVDAAKGMAHVVKVLLDGSIGTLYWRRAVSLDFEPAVGFEKSQQTGFAMSPAGWRVSMRLVIVDGEWDTEPADLLTNPEDYPEWAEMVARYQRGLQGWSPKA